MTTPATLYKFKPVFTQKEKKKEATQNDQNAQNDQEYVQLTDIKDKKDRCEAIDAYLTFSNSCGSGKQSNSTKVRRRL